MVYVVYGGYNYNYHVFFLPLGFSFTAPGLPQELTQAEKEDDRSEFGTTS